MTNEDPAVTRFREYLRFPTVHPDPDYTGCVDWIKNQAKEIGLEFNIASFGKDDEFAVWLTWHGTAPSLKSILLNSHMDVVPILEPFMWKYDPFEATKDAEGNIHARGAVDMKCVGAMYLEAIRRLKKKGFTPLRNIHVSFVPDEEVGGFKGMGAFSVSPQFRRLNVGFALDEGLGSEDDFFNIYYGERAVCQFRVTARGTGGSPVDMLEDCAAEKLHFVISRLMDLRRDQNNLWHSRPDVDLGDITSLNLTMLAGGTDPGIIPDELSAVFDMRVTPQWRMEDVIQFLYDICLQAGPGVTYTLGQHSAVTAATPTSDDNIWWRNFKAAADYLEIKLRARVFPVATDVRFIRESGIPSFGFSPMSNMPLNTDPHDEFINESTFLKGIKIYEVILQRIANVTKSDTTP